MKKNILLLLISFPFLLNIRFENPLPQDINSDQPDSTITLKISAVGDLMCHSVQYQYAKAGTDSFDFNPVYREIKKYLVQPDFTFGNLETVTAGKSKAYSGYPFFNTPDEFISALKNAGFDLLTTSNNHSLDQGEFGLRRTIDVLNKNGLNYNGTFISEDDSDSIRIFDLKGIKIAFLAYTYGTNGVPVPKGKSYLINLIDENKITADIDSARKAGAELVLVHFHFGEEYKREPVASQKKAVNTAVQAGADIIIGGHPHVMQPAEFIASKNAMLDSVFVAYSLGNFISNQRWRYSDAGAILNIQITKNINSDSIYISDVSFLPTWVFKGKTNLGREYIILPAAKPDEYEFLTAEDKLNMKQAFEDTKEIMRKYSSSIRIVE